MDGGPDRQRERLLEAAAAAVASTGPSAVSESGLAGSVGMRGRQIREQFGSVEQLLTTALLDERDRFTAAAFADGGFPDPLVIADHPVFWRSVGQLLLDPGDLRVEILTRDGPMTRLSRWLEHDGVERDRSVAGALAIVWAAMPLGALIFEQPLREGLEIADEDWPECWEQLGAHIRALAEVRELPHVEMPRLPPKSPRSWRAFGSREQLITAAIDLLADQLETSINSADVARRASVDVGLIDEVFGSVGSLFDVALHQMHHDFLDDALESATRGREIGPPDMFFRHQPFIRAWAGRLLRGQPVPSLDLVGMRRLTDSLVARRQIGDFDGAARLVASGDALAATSLKLGWALLEPTAIGGVIERSSELVRTLHAVQHWLLRRPN